MSLDRRRFLKYAGASAAVVGASALGLDYLLSPKPTPPVASSSGASMSALTSSSYSSTSVIESTVPLSTLADLDDPKSGYPELANEIRKLPDFHQDTEQSSEAVNRIATLALQSTDPQVKDAFNIIIRGGTPPRSYNYSVPTWNTELQALFWLAEQNALEQNDTLALSVAMSHGMLISLAADDSVTNSINSDINDFLPFLRSLNDYQDTNGLLQISKMPLEAKVALSWRGNDLGRFGRVYYNLGYACSQYQNDPDWSRPANIHNFYENRARPLSLADYQFNTVSTKTLKEMFEFLVSNHMIPSSEHESALDTVRRIRGFWGDLTDSQRWEYPRPPNGPCENWIYINGEKSRPSNINNANYEWELFQTTGKGFGVSDDVNALVDALIKSIGIPGVSLDYIWGAFIRNSEPSHEETLFYDSNIRKWSAQYFGPATASMDVFIFRPPVMQLNYFDFYTPSLYAGYANRFIPNLYHSIIGVNGKDIQSQIYQGIPTEEVASWFFTPE